MHDVSDSGGPAEPPGQTVEYAVDIPYPLQDSVLITMRVWGHAPGDTLWLVLPPVFADNPFLRVGPDYLGSFQASGSGKVLEPLEDSLTLGPLTSGLVGFATPPDTLRVAYTLHLALPDYTRQPRTRLSGEWGYLQGNYLFAVPYRGGALAEFWREQGDYAVEYHIPATVDLFGDPYPRAEFRSRYELLFSTSAISPGIRHAGGVMGQGYRIVTLPPADSISDADIAKVSAPLEAALGEILPAFGPLDYPVTVIPGENKSGGLEGMFAFTTLPPVQNDSAGVLPMVLAHEILHFWIGVRVGELEDPWWKEGTTSYLGFLVARRSGWTHRDYFERVLLQDLSEDTVVARLALADPEVREYLWAPGRNLIPLVYAKGAQVALLMDAAIHRATGGSRSLLALLGTFAGLYDGRAFMREDYLEFFWDRAGVDFDGLFREFVDLPGAVPDSLLRAEYAYLDSLGVLDPPGSVLARAARPGFFAPGLEPANTGSSQTAIGWAARTLGHGPGQVLP